MKNIILIIATVFLCSRGLYAQAPATTADEINSLWTQNKHDELEVF